jgi:hypothetical protein
MICDALSSGKGRKASTGFTGQPDLELSSREVLTERCYVMLMYYIEACKNNAQRRSKLLLRYELEVSSRFPNTEFL